MVRGELIERSPANPLHAERLSTIVYVIRGHVAAGYVPSTFLLTRVGPLSDFATDLCVRRAGVDPETGTRYLEELAFLLISEQSMPHITIRAKDLAERGVRRVIGVFVEQGEIAEWSRTHRSFVLLPTDAMLEDPTLVRPVPLRALLDAAAANDAVLAALYAKRNPWLMEHDEAIRAQRREAERQQARRTIESVCVALGQPLTTSERERLDELDTDQLTELLSVIAVERRWPPST
ncbi:MAG: hypothetical protein HC927_02345 [Deltaproteobacteria bacterium]|nr:hypothetical protein [Deltaproteobacteria bacterium]